MLRTEASILDFDLILKSLALLIGAIGSAKLIYDWTTGKQSRLREEYKFARDFLDEVSEKRDLHPFLREKGFQAIAGDNRIGADEVEYLLSLKGPERALRDYVLGRPYLEHLPEAGNLQIAFKKKFKSGWSRGWRKAMYLALYIALVFAIFAPLLIAASAFNNPAHPLLAFILSLSVLGPYAFFSVKAGARIHRAEMLVKHQHKHTQRILLRSH